MALLRGDKFPKIQGGPSYNDCAPQRAELTLIITTTSLAKVEEGRDEFKSQFDFLIAQSQIRSIAEQSEDLLTPDVIYIQPEILKYFEFFNSINPC